MSDFDLRYHSDAPTINGNRIEGYAIVYDAPSLPLQFTGQPSPFVETITRGAAKEALQGDTLLLLGHDVNRLLGRTSSGTVRIWEDSKGVAFSAEIPETTLGKDAKIMVGRGDLRGMSFKLDVPKGGDKWHNKDGARHRQITRLSSIPEISLVAMPAYPSTSAALRSFESFLKEKETPAIIRIRELQSFLTRMDAN